MTEPEGTAEQLAQMAASLRGHDPAAKREADRDLIAAIHPPEAEAGPSEDDVDFGWCLFAPKFQHASIVEALHPSEGD